ncbi:hypothetical protein HDU86_007941 [Geranomyces michiganensis]|nr:hypothetical protein HDU86_007941 [Geranomyces michiganensis]
MAGTFEVRNITATFPQSPVSPTTTSAGCVPPYPAVGNVDVRFLDETAAAAAAPQQLPFPAAADFGWQPADYYPTPNNLESLMHVFDMEEASMLGSPHADQFNELGTMDGTLFGPSDYGLAGIPGDALFTDLAAHQQQQDTSLEAPVSPLMAAKREPDLTPADFVDQLAEVAALDWDAPSSPQSEISTPGSERKTKRRSRDNMIYPCTIQGCGKTFTRKYNLQTHVGTHNPDRPRPFRCPHCNKRFLREHDLERHSTVHTKEKNYRCTTPGCDKRFTRPDAVCRHLRKTRCVERHAFG